MTVRALSTSTRTRRPSIFFPSACLYAAEYSKNTSNKYFGVGSKWREPQVQEKQQAEKTENSAYTTWRRRLPTISFTHPAHLPKEFHYLPLPAISKILTIKILEIT